MTSPKKQETFKEQFELKNSLINNDIQTILFEYESMIRDYQAIMKTYKTGGIVIILDNAKIHHAKLLKEFLDENKDRFELMFLPLSIEFTLHNNRQDTLATLYNYNIQMCFQY